MQFSRFPVQISASGLSLTVWSALVVPLPLTVLAVALDGPPVLADAAGAFGWEAALSTLFTAGLASLVGKWARDLLMGRIVRHHRSFDAELPVASGYHDPVTSRFIKATALARKNRGLPDDCFERIPVVGLEDPPPRSKPRPGEPTLF